jgi:hypothetical protein
VTKRTNGRLWYRIEPTTGMPVFGLEGPMSFDVWEQVVDTIERGTTVGTHGPSAAQSPSPYPL